MIGLHIILAAALALNWRSMRMMCLSILIGVTWWLPVSGPLFFPLCAAVELVVGMLALLIGARASRPVAALCGGMASAHLLAWATDVRGYVIWYHHTIVALEYAEILCCLFFSQSRIPQGNPGYNTAILQPLLEPVRWTTRFLTKWRASAR